MKFLKKTNVYEMVYLKSLIVIQFILRYVVFHLQSIHTFKLDQWQN